jgi:hypothetical protein
MRKEGDREGGIRWYSSRTMAIDNILPSNFDDVFYSVYIFPFPPSKEKLKGNVPINMQNSAIRI